MITVSRTSAEDSDTDCGVLHGRKGPHTLDWPAFRPFRVVEFLHAVLPGKRLRAGFALLEVIVAIAVLGAGVVGVAAIGLGARRMTHVAAVRTAQTVAAQAFFEGRTPSPGFSDLVLAADTALIRDGLIEVRVTVDGRGIASDRVWVTRKPVSP